MDINKVVLDFSQRLSKIGIQHFVGGSYASGVWGEARMTNDIDFVLFKPTVKADLVLSAFSDPYSVSADALQSALSDRDEFAQFSIIQTEATVFFDCFLSETPYVKDVLERGIYLLDFEGQELPVATAEAVFISKLRWYLLANKSSQLQKNDLIGLLQNSPDLVESNFFQHWINHFNLQPELEIIQSDLP